MRFSHCLIGACLMAAGHARPKGCKAVPPVTTTSVVWVDPPSQMPTSGASVTSTSSSFGATAPAPPAPSSAGTTNTTVPVPAGSSVVSSAPGGSAPSTVLTSATGGSSGGGSAPPTTTAAPATTATPATTAATPTAPAASPVLSRAYPADMVDQLRDSSFPKLEAFSGSAVAGSGCTLQNAAVRYEWSDLSVPQREEYIASVKCLMNKPSKLSASEAPGAKSRYDDFLAAHIQQTPNIHNTANFLTWHRYFTWAFEQALRNECGYTGYQPYWNWDRYAKDPEHSPLFNGNASSLSGNSPRPGACVNTGPFADMKVNLGPGNSLRYNPRCLNRSISKENAAGTTADKTYALITRSNDITSFQNTMQTPWGVHAMGHFTVGGDPGGDIYTSPGDPYFYLHHCMIDRVYWLWQLQDLQTRLQSVGGNTGAGRPGTLNDLMNLGVNGGDVKLGSLLNTLGGNDGKFCYIYM